MMRLERKECRVERLPLETMMQLLVLSFRDESLVVSRCRGSGGRRKGGTEEAEARRRSRDNVWETARGDNQGDIYKETFTMRRTHMELDEQVGEERERGDRASAACRMRGRPRPRTLCPVLLTTLCLSVVKCRVRPCWPPCATRSGISTPRKGLHPVGVSYWPPCGSMHEFACGMTGSS